MKIKIILFGGSFDPIHLGHIKVAQFCINYLKADKLIFIPAKRSPFKNYNPVSGSDRLAMIELAIKDYSQFSVSDCELIRPAPSYTIDTVNYFQKEYDRYTEFIFLVGLDMAKDIYKWHKFNELMAICDIYFMKRPNCSLPDYDKLAEYINQEQLEKIKNNIIPTPLIDVSSTQIRAAFKNNQTPKEFLDPKVYDYIIKNSLYCES
jgi:nicotinate-nucleotide adenylyltransferase